MNEEDDEFFESLYSDGHWEWDESKGGLAFISHLVPTSKESLIDPVNIVGPIEFKNDCDLIEQQRFKKRLQRKSEGENDVVTLQDVKDVVLYSAPQNLLTPSLINILHLPTTERFLRALILYCQYYVQIADEMSRRSLESEMKIRTQNSLEIEMEYRENLQDVRLLVAKEYATIVLGGDDLKKYHHMGPAKKMRSLSRREAALFESLVRVSVQVVWLALGRKWHNQIETEVHRLFKSKTFNIIDHHNNVNSEANFSSEERFVLMGQCLRNVTKLHTHSPLLNEVVCERDMDYQLFGLGVVRYPRLNSRLAFMERMLLLDEAEFETFNITLGIIGQKRSRFDTMLREIRTPSTSSTSGSRFSVARLASKASRVSTASHKSSAKVEIKLFPDVVIPEKLIHKESLPDSFPTNTHPHKWRSDEQRKKWLRRTANLVHRRNLKKSRVVRTR